MTIKVAVEGEYEVTCEMKGPKASQYLTPKAHTRFVNCNAKKIISLDIFHFDHLSSMSFEINFRPWRKHNFNLPNHVFMIPILFFY